MTTTLGRGRRRRLRDATPQNEPEERRPPVPCAVVFTESEKKTELRGYVFRRADFAAVDFSGADLSYARFEDVDLTYCDFGRANLRGAAFVRCDLRWSAFARAKLGKNRFELACCAGATGLTLDQRRYIQRHGGSFTLDAPRGGL